jgi:hypothetical protein
MIRFERTASVGCVVAGSLGAGLIAIAAGLVYIDMRVAAAGVNIESDPVAMVQIVVAMIVGAIGSILFAGAGFAAFWSFTLALAEVGRGLRTRSSATADLPAVRDHSTNK